MLILSRCARVLLAIVVSVPLMSAAGTVSAKPTGMVSMSSVRVQQPAPVTLDATRCPTGAKGEIRAWLKFNQQQALSDIEKFVATHDVSVHTLGWEWGDNQTHFPVDAGQSLKSAMGDLAEYQKAHLTSLIDSMSRTLEVRKDNKMIVADISAQLADYRNQFEYVSSQPIQVAAIEVVAPAERALALADINQVAVVGCMGKAEMSEHDAPAVTATPPTATYASYSPDSGEVYWDDQEFHPAAPFITNQFRFDDLSEFTGDHRSYEHDIKISPWDFTECRKTTTWNAIGDPYEAITDCRGPVSTNVQSTASWYYDTRMGDQGSDQKDFTMGIRYADTLRTDYTYYFTVSLVRPTESEATVYLDRQLGGAPETALQVAACNLYAIYIGRAAACTFAWANTGQVSYPLYAGEVVFETWND